eukprot:CAMPEP_0174252628 /NCGR_PEP_ID=MMETSP0439-20130205/2016_1 /TAXON_ID=0 /ORGANISM="Stereomyxa ramosa, Strain Chinc5" /LENGTH=660 /DNA_ID=CAMNT_0015333191 /DNA_START=14 /DNA_END=1996 /DNA_ORIENTATION=-
MSEVPKTKKKVKRRVKKKKVKTRSKQKVSEKNLEEREEVKEEVRDVEEKKESKENVVDVTVSVNGDMGTKIIYFESVMGTSPVPLSSALPPTKSKTLNRMINLLFDAQNQPRLKEGPTIPYNPSEAAMVKEVGVPGGATNTEEAVKEKKPKKKKKKIVFPPKSIADIPPPLLHSIFRFIRDGPTLFSITHVCKLWHVLSWGGKANNSVWKKKFHEMVVIVADRLAPELDYFYEKQDEELRELFGPPRTVIYKPMPYVRDWKRTTHKVKRYSYNVVPPEDIDTIPPIVIDNGSKFFRIGVSGLPRPVYSFLALTGYKKYGHNENMRYDYYVGDEVSYQERAPKLEIREPFSMRGQEDWNWEEAQKLWAYGFDKLDVDPSRYPLLTSMPLYSSKVRQKKMMEIFYETFNIPALYIAPQQSLILNACSRSSGLVVDIGDTQTQVVPVWEGVTFYPGVKTSKLLGGKTATSFLAKTLSQTHGTLGGHLGGLPSTSFGCHELIRRIKEASGFVALDYEAEVTNNKSPEYQRFTLPDGNQIEIFEELGNCGELYFQPQKILGDYDDSIVSLPQLIEDSIMASEIDTRKELASSIILAGGGSMMKGLAQRLLKETKAKIGFKMRPNVLIDKDRSTMVWRGGSILSSISTFPNIWTAKETWLEEGFRE